MSKSYGLANYLLLSTILVISSSSSAETGNLSFYKIFYSLNTLSKIDLCQ